MKTSWTIAKRELGAYFSSPVAYVFIVIFLLLAGFFTFNVGRFFERGVADLLPFFVWHPWLYLFLVPAVGMRLWAEELRLGTLELLFTMPVAPWQAILGKFLASWLFLLIALALTFPLVVTVAYLGRPDLGPVLTGYLGSFLIAGAFLAITSFTSALTRNQVVSFILSLVVCLFLILCGWPPVTDTVIAWAPAWVVDALAGVGVMTHFESFQRGVIDSRDLIFFASLVVFFLFTTAVALRVRRA
jgi:ABC-2 type transport system permease protein